jgi:undecaprenyl-diphosphatase
MNLFQALLLGIIQGATEFLPVSSSGHLVLVPWLLDWTETPSLAFDTIVHLGTAIAVLIYFWRDWLALLQGGLHAIRRKSLADDKTRLIFWIIIGTIPAALLGYTLEDFFEDIFSKPIAVASFLLVTAMFLTLAERLGQRKKSLEQMTWLDALVIGCGQALAIVPGISRSGATIAAGLARKLDQTSAARFSFLLATPIILGVGGLKVLDLLEAGTLTVQIPLLITGFSSAGITGLGCIHFLMRYLQRRSLYPFAIYCGTIGITCLIVAATGLR